MSFIGGHLRPGNIGLLSTVVALAGAENMILLDADHIIDHGSGPSKSGAFAHANLEAAVFTWGASANHRSYIGVPIPSEWQGENINITLLAHHKSSGLSGGGADDQVYFEFSYELLSGGVASDLDTENGGTGAGTESNVSTELGTAEDAPKQIKLIENLSVGANDTWLWARYNRPQGNANDTLDAAIYVIGAIIEKAS